MSTLLFWISKLVWALVRPDTILVLLIVAAFWALLRNRIRLATGLIGAVAFCSIAISFLPLGTLLLAPLESRYPANPEVKNADAIILLGGAEKQDTTERWGVPSLSAAGDRYLATLALARRFPQAQVYFAGGSGQLIPTELSEATIARAVLLSAGLAPSRLHVESVSRNTAENAEYLLARLGERETGNAILVTTAGHMPRAMATFCAAGWTNLTAWPVDYSSGYFVDEIEWSFAENLDDLNGGVREWLGLVFYRLTGRTERLVGADCR
ncbi:YdcF family protein [Altererythrobacter soli]|uniref:YdcF family protein n=1 Tax=Croceibacterium soli TaxID=1739690 RepID=A0A6I4UU89_9SPHN|nr:YdcF family protein [Croceibacterium soli]MXP41364.1 YdcF family protein [Croceibacterium soli]